jgi:hypothetical protein
MPRWIDLLQNCWLTPFIITLLSFAPGFQAMMEARKSDVVKTMGTRQRTIHLLLPTAGEDLSENLSDLLSKELRFSWW